MQFSHLILYLCLFHRLCSVSASIIDSSETNFVSRTLGGQLDIKFTVAVDPDTFMLNNVPVKCDEIEDVYAFEIHCDIPPLKPGVFEAVINIEGEDDDHVEPFTLYSKPDTTHISTNGNVILIVPMNFDEDKDSIYIPVFDVFDEEEMMLKVNGEQCSLKPHVNEIRSFTMSECDTYLGDVIIDIVFDLYYKNGSGWAKVKHPVFFSKPVRSAPVNILHDQNEYPDYLHLYFDNPVTNALPDLSIELDGIVANWESEDNELFDHDFCSTVNEFPSFFTIYCYFNHTFKFPKPEGDCYNMIHRVTPTFHVDINVSYCTRRYPIYTERTPKVVALIPGVTRTYKFYGDLYEMLSYPHLRPDDYITRLSVVNEDEIYSLKSVRDDDDPNLFYYEVEMMDCVWQMSVDRGYEELPIQMWWVVGELQKKIDYDCGVRFDIFTPPIIIGTTPSSLPLTGGSLIVNLDYIPTKLLEKYPIFEPYIAIDVAFDASSNRRVANVTAEIVSDIFRNDLVITFPNLESYITHKVASLNVKLTAIVDNNERSGLFSFYNLFKVFGDAKFDRCSHTTVGTLGGDTIYCFGHFPYASLTDARVQVTSEEVHDSSIIVNAKVNSAMSEISFIMPGWNFCSLGPLKITYSPNSVMFMPLIDSPHAGNLTVVETEFVYVKDSDPSLMKHPCIQSKKTMTFEVINTNSLLNNNLGITLDNFMDYQPEICFRDESRILRYNVTINEASARASDLKTFDATVNLEEMCANMEDIESVNVWVWLRKITSLLNYNTAPVIFIRKDFSFDSLCVTESYLFGSIPNCIIGSGFAPLMHLKDDSRAHLVVLQEDEDEKIIFNAVFISFINDTYGEFITPAFEWTGRADVMISVRNDDAIDTFLDIMYKSCELGYFQESYSHECHPCPVGKYCPSHSAEPILCEQNTYSDQPAMSECLKCPDNSISGEGSDRIEDCECVHGYFGNSTVGCHECDLDSSTCNFRDNTYPKALPGYWNDIHNDPGTMYRCLNEGCLGAQLTSSNPYLAQCEEGFDNTSLACSSCARGYYKKGESCEECSGTSWIITSILACGIIAFIYFLVSVQGTLTDYTDDAMDAWENIDLSIIKSAFRSGLNKIIQFMKKFDWSSVAIFLNYMQITTLLKDFRLEWPDFMKSIFSWFRSFSFNVDVSGLSVQCSKPLTTYNFFVLKMLTPVFFLFLLIFVVICTWIWSKVRGNQFSLWEMIQKCLSVSVLAAYYGYTFLADGTLGFFNCTQQPHSFVMTSNPDTLCYDDEWFSYRKLAFGGIIVYVVGIPAFLFYQIFKASRKRELDSPFFKLYFSSITEDFEEDYVFYTSVIMIRKICLVLCTFIGRTDIENALYSVLFITIFLSLQIRWMPYDDLLNDILDTMTLVTVFISQLDGIVLSFNDDKALSQSIKDVFNTLNGVMLIANLLFFLFVIRQSST
ncbi:hypothetical protein PCE1_000839 [Barthelona sp. PCE]